MRRALAVLILVGLLASFAGAVELRFAVTQRSASTVYIAGGSANGLAVGERLTIKLKNEVVGEVEILYLAEHSASCRIVNEVRPIRAGDAAVIVRAADHDAQKAPEVTVSDTATKALPATSDAAPAPLTARAATSKSRTRTRGAVSLGASKSWDDTERHYDYQDRQARLDFSASEIGGQPLFFTVRGRSRQDVRPQTLGFEGLSRNERRDRLYEFSFRYQPRNGRAIVDAGRLGAPLIGLGYLDGLSAEIRALKSLRVGGFFGRRADLDALSGVASGNKYGGWLRLADGGMAWPAAYDVNVFGVREFAGSAISREYVGMQSRFGRKAVTFSQWAEVDLLRDWRKPAAGSAVQLSNLSASLRYRASASSSLAVSYDQRRNYRSAETRSVPEVLFDTFAHQGFRSSLDLSRANGLGGSLSGGVRLADSQSATAYSLGAGVRHPSLTGAHLNTGLDGYYFSNGITSGIQGSARVGRSGPKLMLDLSYGLSRYTLTGGGTTRQNQWYRLSAYRTFAHGLWLRAEAQLDRGDDVKGPRGAFEFGYRF